MQKTFEIKPGLFLIDLPQPAEGFEKFISAWFFRDDRGKNILVETGPANTIPALAEELSKLTGSLDHILLTHIHLDHSGGLGHLMPNYPDAKVFVSAKGKKHLISPGKLWDASVSNLGDFAKLYGEPLPVPPDIFLDEKEGAFLHEINAIGTGFSVSVVAGGPELFRRDRRLQFVFANNRRIQDFALLQALEYGLQGWFPNATHPIGAVFVTIDPALADFNIHPAKREVR
ncbi:MAG: MBL fold metallo-hydrolase, partial [Synergistaceae bacterium]|nr:MBL fold metallo-hydrolase [Synergistaceae bacterium]